MLIGGSEALEGMQISPALLRYPSVPLPVLSNPFIPPDWSRGGRGGEHSCQFVASIPWAQAVSRDGGRAGGTAAAFALIRGWASRSMSCTVHQRRSASQPESQMTPSTCRALLKPFLLLISPTPSITFYYHFFLLLPITSTLSNCHQSSFHNLQTI